MEYNRGRGHPSRTGILQQHQATKGLLIFIYCAQNFTEFRPIALIESIIKIGTTLITC